MKLHASGEDYLETILVLQKKLGMVRSVDVARHMGVSKPSVCVAVNTLKDTSKWEKARRGLPNRRCRKQSKSFWSRKASPRMGNRPCGSL